jgi:hypothetical protein
VVSSRQGAGSGIYISRPDVIKRIFSACQVPVVWYRQGLSGTITISQSNQVQ